MMTRKLPVGDGESPAKFGCDISFVAIRQIPTTLPIYLEFAPFPNPKKRSIDAAFAIQTLDVEVAS